METSGAMRLKFVGNTFSWYFTGGSQGAEKLIEKDVVEKQPTTRFFQRANRRSLGWLKLMYSLDEDPYWFISLRYPEQELIYLSADRVRNDICSLANAIRCTYEKAWFLYYIDWGEKYGPHIHLVGRKGKKPKSKKRTSIKKRVAKIWQNVTEANEKGPVDVRKFDASTEKFHFGYLTSKRKKFAQQHVVAFMGPKLFSFGRIGMKYIPYSKPQHAERPVEMFDERIRCILEKNLEEQALVTGQLNVVQLGKVKGSYAGLHILTDELKAELMEVISDQG